MQAAADPVQRIFPLAFVWQTADPFIFCVYHFDKYPAGNEQMGVDSALLRGRDIGQDFDSSNGWRMYHGESVPGFPRHPHRGFETLTVVRKGVIDHADSAGATARYGDGDAQWMTAGKGIQHSEMFPLRQTTKDNPLELFQIWINLPASDKFVEPHFSMFWAEQMPTAVHKDANSRLTELSIVAGTYEAIKALPPPPHSWAARNDSDVAVWTVRMEPNALWTLPPAKSGSNRHLYYFKGKTLKIAGQTVKVTHGIALIPDVAVQIENGAEESQLLLLQGRPIAEPVVQSGPFVMNTKEQIKQAFADYHRTQFGSWKWGSDAPVHPKAEGRFALYPDGKKDEPPAKQ